MIDSQKMTPILNVLYYTSCVQAIQTRSTAHTVLCTVSAIGNAQWRIQELQTGGAKVERRRREYRGAEGAEGVGCGEEVFPYPVWRGLWRGQIFLTLDLKMSTSSAF